MNLLTLLQEQFRPALASLCDDPAFAPPGDNIDPYLAMIKPTQDAKFGDYQANCAMSLAKALKKKPRDVAQEIIDKLDLGTFLETPEIAGPGFINLRIQANWMAHRLQEMARSPRLGVDTVNQPKKYVIDFSSPNVAKPMHVGHLRSTIIGDAIARLLRFLGHEVITDNHLGDWGTQFGMILWAWKNHRDDAAYEADPVSELARLYRLTSSIISPYEKLGRNFAKVRALETEGKQAEADELYAKTMPSDKPREAVEAEIARGRAVDEASRIEVSKLHAGDPENRKLWEQFIPNCLDALKRVYSILDITFDEWLGESAYDKELPRVVEDLEKKNLAVLSEGALVVPVEGLHAPFMIRKSDGAFNYATTDLATIKYRQEHFRPDVVLYVVDHRQGDHFKALFDVAARWGYDNITLKHIGFGTIMGKDGKPYKTREGDVVGLESLLDEAVVRARKTVEANSPDLPADEKPRVAEVVGLGAVKYADLSQNRTSDYTFDWDKMLAMEGNTATYMQYAYARNRSIFRRGEEDVERFRSHPVVPLLDTPQERALAVQLLRLEEALSAAAVEYQPHLITTYLWDLAKTYSGFFQNCPVLKAETPMLRESRLLLCDLTARVLQLCLQLLGIRTAERM